MPGIPVSHSGMLRQIFSIARWCYTKPYQVVVVPRSRTKDHQKMSIGGFPNPWNCLQEAGYLWSPELGIATKQKGFDKPTHPSASQLLSHLRAISKRLHRSAEGDSSLGSRDSANPSSMLNKNFSWERSCSTWYPMISYIVSIWLAICFYLMFLATGSFFNACQMLLMLFSLRLWSRPQELRETMWICHNAPWIALQLYARFILVHFRLFLHLFSYLI